MPAVRKVKTPKTTLKDKHKQTQAQLEANHYARLNALQSTTDDVIDNNFNDTIRDLAQINVDTFIYSHRLPNVKLFKDIPQGQLTQKELAGRDIVRCHKALEFDAKGFDMEWAGAAQKDPQMGPYNQLYRVYCLAVQTTIAMCIRLEGVVEYQTFLKPADSDSKINQCPLTDKLCTYWWPKMVAAWHHNAVFGKLTHVCSMQCACCPV